MTDIKWLSRNFIDAIHYELIREHGGKYGIQNGDYIDRALELPKKKWLNGEKDIIALAAAYATGFMRNRGFFDGNHRVPLMAMFSFLYINGYKFNADNSETVLVFNQVYKGKIEPEALIKWISEHSKPKKKRSE